MSVLEPKTTRTQRDKNAANCTLPARSDLKRFIHFLSLSGPICKKWKKKLWGEDQSGDEQEREMAATVTLQLCWYSGQKKLAL